MVIESDVSRLRRAAIKAHNQWLSTGTTADRREYGYALKDLARLTRNRKMLDYAEQLLQDKEGTNV
jgi:hypothetical protein